MFSGHNGIILEIKKQKDLWKTHNYLEANCTLLNNLWVKDKIKKEIKNYFEQK